MVAANITRYRPASKKRKTEIANSGANTSNFPLYFKQAEFYSTIKYNARARRLNRKERNLNFYRNSAFEDIENMAIFIVDQISGLTLTEVGQYNIIQFFKMFNRAEAIFNSKKRNRNG